MTLEIVSLVLLIGLSGFFSSAETAFTSLSLMQLKHLEEERGRRGRIVKRLSSQPDTLITTILIGNNLVNIAATAISTQLTISLFGNRFVGIMTGVLTLVILIFAEVTPKQVALRKNEFIALRSCRFLLLLTYLLRPFILLITFTTSFITRFFTGDRRNRISLEGILHIVSLGEDQGVVEDYETDMVKSVFRFNDVPIQAIMTHRTDVFSIEKHERIRDVLEPVNEKGYTRIPVYDDHPENIVGIVLEYDIIKAALAGRMDVQVSDIMVEPFFVAPHRKLDVVFREFKSKKLNIAVVLDEYGGLAGIVTREDIIEELLGELFDENEEHGFDKIIAVEGNGYRIMGDTSIHQVNDTLGIDLPTEKHSKTIAGYIAETLGRIPTTGETLTLPGVVLTVEDIRKNRIISVLCDITGDDESFPQGILPSS